MAAETAGIISLRRWRLRTPRKADDWSTLFAIIATAMVPIWFLIVSWWNPHYEPKHGWVWAIPAVLTQVYLYLQLAWLVVSLMQSEKIGLLDLLFSGLAMMMAFGTFITMLNQSNHYSAFHWMFIILIVFNTIVEFGLTIAIRMLVNRRTIAGVAASAPAGDDHQQGHASS